MGKINTLSQELINQIAAGEVVERPASVVKELVENSIDAGALDIVVEIQNGGINLIKVTDNGCGMNREDAEKSIEQHATSKLSEVDDLYKINSLGFRGEALASISSVSKFVLLTKDHASLAGTRVEMINNEVKIGDAGCPSGTSVEIADLFYNVPARQKYLKTPVTEFNNIIDLFLNYCLTYPEISWKLVNNGKPTYQFPATKIEQRIADVLGEEISNNLIPIDIKLNDVYISGFVGKPQIARNNRKIQYLFINKRPVNEYIVAKKVKDAYTTLIPRDLYPVYLLNLEVNTEKVDVNVHPRKLEVRFSEPQVIYRTVYSSVSRVLDENDLIKTVNAQEMNQFVPVGDVLETKKQISIPIKNHNSINQPQAITVSQRNGFVDLGKRMADPVFETRQEVTQVSSVIESVKRNYKILAQVQDSYIIVETDTGLKIYDQHASSERVQYEKLKTQWKIGKLSSQKMLLPQTIELTPAESRLVNENMDLFNRLGFDISDFGGNSFAISSVPLFLVKLDLKQVVMEIVGGLDEVMILDDKISEPVDRILRSMSCRSAIMFGDPLSNEGMEALIDDLEALGSKYTCVHGRPCVMEFSFIDLEKMFKRRT